MASRTGDSDSESPVKHQGSLQFHSPASWDANSNSRPSVAGTPSTSSGFYCSVQMFEEHAGVHSAELPVDARVHARVSGGGVGRTPLAQRLHEQPEGGVVPHVFTYSLAGWPGRAGCGVRLSARSGLGCSSMQITG